MTLNSATLLHSSQASNRHYTQPLPRHTSQFPTPTPTTLPPSVSYSANFIKAVNARVLDLLSGLLETAFQSEITRMQLEKRLRRRPSTLCSSHNNATSDAKSILFHYSNKTQDGTLFPRCSPPPLHWAHWVCTDIIMSIVLGRWRRSCSKPSWPCGNNGNAKLQLCVRCITRPDGTVSEEQRQRVGSSWPA